MDGFLLVDKQIGWTSRGVCNKIRHNFHFDKVGHTGTLDPFATGLLIVSINKASKLNRFIEDDDKEYIAEIALGTKTNTGDLTGEIIEKVNVPSLKEDYIKNIVNSFLGKQKQIPPMTSAIHYEGVKLYELAHQGINVEREPRDIEIKKIEVLSFISNILTIKAVVSKGTYLRVLGEDIAVRLGTVGHLKSLRRTRIGNLNIEDAKKVEELQLENLISSYDLIKNYLPIQFINSYQIKDIKDGKVMRFNREEDLLLVVDENKTPLAIYEKNEECYHIIRGLW